MKHQKTEIVQSVLPLDGISNMPDNVLETILMCLTTRDAVRMSILSRKWRHVWSSLPQFELDEEFWREVTKEHSAGSVLRKIWYQLSTKHDGPIKTFTLSNYDLVSYPEIDNLIDLIARRNVEDFRLEMGRDWPDCYSLPNSFFSCQQLRHLRLGSCSIRIPPNFKGFCMLNTLILENVTINVETLSSLISGSPLLVDLELCVYSCMDIYIDAPNLRTFTFYGQTKLIMFQRVPVLASVSIFLQNKFQLDFGQFFQPLLSLESLELSCNIAKNFGHTVEGKLPTTLILKDLKLHELNFNKVDDVLFTIWLLRRSPYLKFIQIWFIDRSCSNFERTTTYIEGEDHLDIWLSELTDVELYCVTGTKPELEFTRLLLAKSSSLKKFQVWLKEGLDNEIEIREQVTKFPRLSNEVEIIFEVMTRINSL